MGDVTREQRRAIYRFAALVIFIAVAAAAAWLFPLPSLGELQGYFSNTRWGPVLFVLGYAVLTLSPVPKNVLSIGAGAVFGFAAGIGVVIAAALLGSTAAFWLGR
ncbi:hypothetical protein [Arthrobacter sp. ISL-72]|uniref:hypothetical protein n=1 Tax=Arthrobacter sp. ISL-72 TaxID=2819114 RepID=UPI001BE801E3|nr:hypothetical protein [Arthrobacter sp. ISL-72]MBT2596465.1 hypothetical protein [Arthrobacter sp. ISL-72]